MVSFPVALTVASLLGLLAGMGVGGGSLLLLWLTQVVSMAQPQARLLNLLFYIPAALTATLFRRKQGKSDLRITVPAIILGCCSAALISLISAQWNLTLLRKILGVLLILTGIREICYRPRNAK